MFRLNESPGGGTFYTMDKIFLHNCSLLCNIGVEEQERHQKQELLIDVELSIDATSSAMSKNLSDTIDYAKVHDLLKTIVENGEYVLVEELAEKIAHKCLHSFTSPQILVRIKKPRVAEKCSLGAMGVEIVRPNL